MNRFKQLIDEARQRAVAAGLPEEPARQQHPEEETHEGEDVAEISQVRMPYSSDPEPIGEAWSTD